MLLVALTWSWACGGPLRWSPAVWDQSVTTLWPLTLVSPPPCKPSPQQQGPGYKLFPVGKVGLQMLPKIGVCLCVCISLMTPCRLCPCQTKPCPPHSVSDVINHTHKTPHTQNSSSITSLERGQQSQKQVMSEWVCVLTWIAPPDSHTQLSLNPKTVFLTENRIHGVLVGFSGWGNLENAAGLKCIDGLLKRFHGACLALYWRIIPVSMF